MIERNEMEIELTGKTMIKVIFDYKFTGIVIHEKK